MPHNSSHRSRARRIVRKRLQIARILGLVTVALIVVDLVGISNYYRRLDGPTSSAYAVAASDTETAQAVEELESDSSDGSSNASTADVDKSAATTAVDPIDLTLENLAKVSGDATISTEGFQLSDADSQEIQAQIDDFTAAGYSAAFVVADLDTGAVLAYDGGEAKYSASSIKGPYVLSLAATGTIDLDDVMNETDSAAATDNYYITNAIQISDNDCYYGLFNEYGKDPINTWMEGTGIQHNVGDLGDDVPYVNFSAIDLAMMWTKGYQYLFTDTTDEAAEAAGKASVEAREWLASNYQDTLNSSIHIALGDEDRVMSKAGWISEAGYYALNDGGIVFPGLDGTSSYGGVAVTSRPTAYVMTLLTDACGEYDMVSGLAKTLDAVYQNSMGGSTEGSSSSSSSSSSTSTSSDDSSASSSDDSSSSSSADGTTAATDDSSAAD
ncbi:serine hydrolase [Bifidobacterium choloepi]|uniref:Serine hydrolase n=1 Tax=Bifidobacterium choloepi TaxID=2614131 RepID=A0A6I5NHV4_9BIFI|nr:serine hydrolase [Bifidobacterium choloepi]NEG69913.1 serine hydrolase [Bifidobacterium choloepi]